MVCERCDPSCSKCSGQGNRTCLSCRDGYVYLRQTGQCLERCPSSYYHDSWSKTCNGGGALACQSCYEGYTFMGGICVSKCIIGFYTTSQVCKECDQSCLDCRGPSMWNCTVCHSLQILADDGRCLSCCGNEMGLDDKPIPRECCDCKASQEECILGVNFVMQDLEDQGSSRKLFVTVCVLLILSVGGGVFLFLHVRSKSTAIAGVPKIKSGGYEKLDSNRGVGSYTTTSTFGEFSDRIVECEDDEGEEEDDDDDIVYMTQDGTVYRKFKYGLLDEDEIDLEYDDESYSYR